MLTEVSLKRELSLPMTREDYLDELDRSLTVRVGVARISVFALLWEQAACRLCEVIELGKRSPVLGCF